MLKKHRALLFSLTCILLASIGFFYAKRQPILFLSNDTDLTNPSRYVFLTENEQPSALVIDIENKTSFGRLALPTIAKYSSIDKHSNSLVVSDGLSLFAQNLSNGKRNQMTLSASVEALATHKQTLAIRAGTTFSLYHLPDLSKITEINPVSQNASLHYADLQSRWLLLENPPAIVLFDTHTQYTPLPYQKVHAAALSPNNQLLAFTATNTEGKALAVIWSLETQQALQEYPLNAPSLRPLIDNRSEFIYFVDNIGDGLQFSNKNISAPPRQFHTLQEASDIALGFLETRLLVRNKNTIALIDTNSLKTLATHNLPEMGHGLFITADSKTALIGGQQQLFILQLMHNKLSAITLPETIQPQKIFMGVSNTLCH